MLGNVVVQQVRRRHWIQTRSVLMLLSDQQLMLIVVMMSRAANVERHARRAVHLLAVVLLIVFE